MKVMRENEVMPMMNNKRYMPKFMAVFILSLSLLFIGITPVMADSEDTAETSIIPISATLEDEGVDAIAITIIVPPLQERPTPVQPAPPTRRVFPINVAEGYNYEGVRELVRIYELLPGESPDWINTDSFTRNGYYYQIAEIIRRIDVAHTVREHMEIVEFPSSTNNLGAVIASIDPTMDFVDEDGYVGVLHLDIRSIEMTQDGTRSTSRTVSQTREFPHLSNPDMSLIPLTINVSGRTYSLADVDWRTNTTNPIDFNSVAQTFTAFATYTRTATSTVSTGYTTTAVYSGTLTRVSTGEVRFVATFIGTPIVSPIVNRPVTPSPEQDKPTDEATSGEEQPYIGIEKPIGDISENGGDYEQTTTDAETTQIPNYEPVRDNHSNGLFPWLLLLAIPLLLIIATLIVMLLKFKKRADFLEEQSHRDSSAALSFRMASIIHNDRRELAEHAGDEYSDDDNFESLEVEKNPDEDGDNDD